MLASRHSAIMFYGPSQDVVGQAYHASLFLEAVKKATESLDILVSVTKTVEFYSSRAANCNDKASLDDICQHVYRHCVVPAVAHYGCGATFCGKVVKQERTWGRIAVQLLYELKSLNNVIVQEYNAMLLKAQNLECV